MNHHHIYCVFVLSLFTCFCVGIEVTYHIQEERQPRVLIGNVGEDANLSSVVSESVFQNMRYSFLNSGPRGHEDKFDIEERSGALSTVVALDRESLCPFQVSCVLDLRVGAASGGYFGDIYVHIIVDDINDNSPAFSDRSMHVDISEGSSINFTFPVQDAVDLDMGPSNTLQDYELIRYTDVFGLVVQRKDDGGTDVSIRLKQTLDRENQDQYQMYVVAKDGGNPQRSGMLLVNVTVTDVNDNKPLFLSELYNITIKEDFPFNVPIVNVSATDLDTGVNSVIRYRFGSRQSNVIDAFAINSVTGAITVTKTLTAYHYLIVIEAFDQGTPALSSQSKVEINVLDTDNTAPEISINTLSDTDEAKIFENSERGSIVAHIAVIDRDRGTNGQVNCSINNPFFRLQKRNTSGTYEYTVVVDTLLNREDMIEHVISVYCEDRGSPPKNSTGSFVVQVLDRNDNNPVFTNNIYYERIMENNLPGKVITKVSATDADQGDNAQVRYSMGSHSDDFFIAPNTGIIKVNRAFDREVMDHVRFTVIATDNGSPARSATATIDLTIKDENDETPTFDKSVFEFTVVEEIMTSVGNLTATDLDEGENGRITFTMHPEAYATTPFTVFPNGEIKTNRKLDREVRDRYEFRVQAKDNGLHFRNSTARVIVIVADINDNPPEFTFPKDTNNSVKLSYLTTPNEIVTTIEATDADIGPNAEISYAIIRGNDENLFKIDRNSGEIMLTRDIHLNEIKVYELDIAAEDNGIPQMSRRQSLNIIVHFVNVTEVQPLVDNKGQNILIAVSIGCVTFILSILIILIICIIRQVDMKKRNNNTKSFEEMKIMHTLGRGNSNRSSSSKGSQDVMVPITKNKKEVSFSLDEDSDASMTFSIPTSNSNTGMVTFKSGSPSPMIEKNQKFDSAPHSRQSSGISDTKQQAMHRMASLRVQQQLLKQNDPQSWQQNAEGEVLQLTKENVNAHEEAHSDSLSQSTTSDSGRGGSEEDLRNATLSQRSESDRSQQRPESRLNSHGDSSGVSSISYTSGANRPILKTFGHHNRHNPQTIGQFQRPLDIPRNSNSETVSIQPSRPHSCQPKLQRLHSDHYNPMATHDHGQFPRMQSDMDRFKQYHSDRNLKRTSHLGGSGQLRSFDDTISESCATTRDDDDATTTSGSYTLNADDLCNEIDELFFKPDTVV